MKTHQENTQNLQIKEDVDNAIKVMEEGGVILYPTDTIWGLGCDATNSEAVKRIYEIKQRQEAKALITLVDSELKIQSITQDIPEVAWDLMELSERPVTVIFDEGRNVAANLLAEDGSIAVRITHETFSKELCRKFKKPIVSTSANISGGPSAQNFTEISEDIKKRVDYIVKYRQNDLSKAQPSMIIKLGKGSEIKIIRG